MHTSYKSTILRELRDQQVRFAPREKKVEQVNRAERLLQEIDTNRTYTYEYLCFRITDYRPDAAPERTVSGQQVKHDLRLFVEDVSDAADLRVEDVGEPVHSVEELSQIFNVSTKTISRWRDNGLVARRFSFGDRKRVGFLKSTVDQFVAKNKAKIDRGERFSQISNDERMEIVLQAREFVNVESCRTEVVRQVAKACKRSAEAIRYTLKQFDEENPEIAVFPGRSVPLDSEAKERIYLQFRRGTSIEQLTRRFRRTRASVYRIVNEMRAKRINELPLDYIPNTEFETSDADERILAKLPVAAAGEARRARAPTGLPAYLSSLYETPLLTAAQEQHLFRKMNYVKYKASRLRESIKDGSPKASPLDAIEKLYEQAIALKNEIIQANLRLVVSISKRHVNSTNDFYTLVSDGNISLFKAVEKFDYSRGNKFSTYASWAIMKNFARSIPEEYKYHDRFRTSIDEVFATQTDQRNDSAGQEREQLIRTRQIRKILSHLDEREQKIIISRFGLDYSHEPQTLKEVGEGLGVTKERVRQLEARALDKLRAVAEEESLDTLE